MRPAGTRPKARGRARAPPGCANARAAAGTVLPKNRGWAASAMACRAARSRRYVVVRLEPLAQPELLLLAAGRDGHAEALLARPQEALRIPVAVQAPAHGERRPLLHLRHLVDAAVAGDATHALLHVDRVVEVDEVRQLVDLVPDDGPVREETLPHRRELGALVPHLRV